MSPELVRWLLSCSLQRLGCGTLSVIEPDGTIRRFGSGAEEAEMQIYSDRVWAAFLRGSLGLADAYADGLWDSPDLVALVRLAARAMPALDRLRLRGAPVLRPVELARALRRPHGRGQRRRDIAAHYDLGNELFSQMLDPTMTYSCALFSDRDVPLVDAQLAKLELVCDKLGIGAEDHVLEIGSGWGSFALHAATTRGCRVTTTTISREQHRYVSERVEAMGLTGLVTVLDHDFHDLYGSYDKLVSIEMIEAVGWRGFGRFLGHCSSLLRPDGAMLLQAITIDDRAYAAEKATRSFIKEYIFPGGTLPSLSVLVGALARRTDFQVLGLEDLTADYVETLRRWRRNLAENIVRLEDLGYDERFRRIWSLYLAYCEGGFAERRIGDVQILLGKPGFKAPRPQAEPLRACA